MIEILIKSKSMIKIKSEMRTGRVAVLLFVMAVTYAGLLHAAEPNTDVAPAGSAALTADGFPRELVEFTPYERNPLFAGAGAGHWDVTIRERGWILREGDVWKMWYTGYDGTREGRRMLGYATSPDGIAWTRYPGNPLDREHWIEDMMVIRQKDRYVMFAEGLNDQAQLLTSADGIRWTSQGSLDVRYVNGKPLTPGPYGTPTAWFENDTWYLFYERSDKGVWLATSKDLKVWTNVQDEPVLIPGPDEYDRDMIAMNQIIKHEGRYFAYYHGLRKAEPTPGWTTEIAMSRDLIHWVKYAGNPLLRENQSSGIVVYDGKQWRLYSMHPQVRLHLQKK
jgi:hypothetical protein